MKARTSFLKRCLAFALALVLLASSANMGIVTRANAAKPDSTTAGKLVASNYDLTEAEENLLNSGLLAEKTYTYDVPEDADGLVSVNTDKKEIKAESPTISWNPTAARIVVGGETKETVTLTEGKGTYTYGENAFAVQVDYELKIEVPAANQETLLNTAGWLKDGVSYANAVSGQGGNLYILEEAMPDLVTLADNGIQATGFKVNLPDSCKSAIYALNNQMTANGGKLDLSKSIETYDASIAVEYVLKNGAQMKAQVDDLVANITDIHSALNTMVGELDNFVKYGLVSADQANKVKTLVGIVANLTNSLTAVSEANWTAAEKGTALVSETIDDEDDGYVKLNALVAALGETSANTVKNPLKAAETTVAQNMSMFNVNVKVVLKTVEDKADSAVLVEAGTESKTLTLAADATKAEILAAVDASGIEAAAKTAWGENYVEGKFDVKKTTLPETLTEDTEYTITYSPKNYTITYGYVDASAPTSVPYGYQLTLPKHNDTTKAYDYTVNGEKKAQNEVVKILGDTTIARAAGKSYDAADLYGVVANNYGDALTKEILTSGALKDNVYFSYRTPDPADAESILELLDGTLTADNYPADYAGLEWAPDTYGAAGTENTFSGNTASWSGKEAKVLYKLTLSNFGQETAQNVLKLATILKAEAEEQKGAMDSLAGMEDDLAMLDKTKLGAMNGVIDVTDFSSDAAENAEIKAELKSVISAIISNHLDGNNLKLYSIVKEYNADGMSYYYKNYDEIFAEVDSLSGYMTNLMDNEEALKIMCNAAGYPQYADKISDVETQLNDYKARLSAPNAKIDVESENLGKLVAALIKIGDTKCEATGAPYIMSETITALDESQVNVQIIIETPEGKDAVTTDSVDRGTVFTQDMLNDLVAKADDKVAKLLGENIKYYTKSTDGVDLTTLVGTPLDAQANAYWTYTVKEYTVKIDGEADQTVTISDLEINLPKHPTNGWVYKYTVDGVAEITSSTYTFTTEQIDRLFVGGTYTITRVAINEGEEKLEGAFEDWLVKDTDGNVTGLFADVDGNKDGVMGFAMKIVDSGYTYIGLNNEPLLYMNEEDTLEIKLQTLINALMKDNQFGSDTLINLGKNGKGEFVHASMQLGNDDDDIVYEDLDFTLYLNSVPSQMATVSKAMETIKPYMGFKSNDGVMDVNINLPEKVYEVYLAAMLATENVTKDNMEAINSEIAFQFLWDYVDLIMATEANTTTYTNTLAMLDKEYDLTGYEDYYQLVKKALTNPGVVVDPAKGDEKFDMSVTGKSKKAIDGLINVLGIDVSAYNTYLNMIYEYKYDDAEISMAARANLKNTEKNFQAALIDLNAAGVTNKFDFTNNLPARVAEIADKAAVILLDDVTGDLTFKGTTILDLNGQTVNGNIASNGTLIIVDSALDTDNGGKVTGSVSGNVQIIAGSYDADVSAFLKDGYKQEGGAVQNTLYSIESNGNDVCFVLNPDVMSEGFPNVKALAVDIVADLVLNYYTAAALTAENNGLYNVNIDDLIGLISSSNKVDDLIVKVLGSVNAPGMSKFANIIIEDLLSFGDLAKALVEGSEIASYEMGTAPWAVTVEHKTDKDYITFGIGSTLNQKTRAAGKSFNVSLKFSDPLDKDNKLVKLLTELGNVVVATATVDLEQPTYDGAKNALSIVGNANVDATLTLNKDSNYATILAVILANGNASQKDALVAAVNAGDMAALKKAIDNTSVAELFTALKVLNRSDKFATVAKNVGVTVDVEDAAKIEDLYHLFLCAGGKVLEELDITGMNSKFGALDKDGDGVYVFEEDATRKPSASARGYSVYAEGTVAVKLTVALFGEEDCLWGDVDHKNGVDTFDAAYVLQYYVGNRNFDFDFCEEKANVDQNDDIDTFDAAYILQRYVGNISLPVVE